MTTLWLLWTGSGKNDCITSSELSSAVYSDLNAPVLCSRRGFGCYRQRSVPVTGRLSERSCASRAVISCIYLGTVNNIRMRVIATSSDEVSKYQRQVSVLLVTWAAHRRLIGKLLVFYSDFKSRWDRCRVISRQSQQNRNPKGKKRRRRNRSICTELSLSQSINQAFIADSKAHKTHTQKKKGICAHAHTHTHQLKQLLLKATK